MIKGLVARVVNATSAFSALISAGDDYSQPHTMAGSAGESIDQRNLLVTLSRMQGFNPGLNEWKRLAVSGDGEIQTTVGTYLGAINQGEFTATGASAEVIPANVVRKYLHVQNQDTTNSVWISFAGSAFADAKSYEVKAGQTFTFNNNVPAAAMHAITGGSSIAVQFMEY